ncbi:hypothetical protein [Rhodanobacter sp. 115]|uniref:hypothetical protein n=1 Tax=Rhodanobacter sp. FW021-MT20 TaxID=1162282 RepID=UPI0009D9C028|nr:hypothetical protein [Rhodanobacter sp. 115]
MLLFEIGLACGQGLPLGGEGLAIRAVRCVCGQCGFLTGQVGLAFGEGGLACGQSGLSAGELALLAGELTLPLIQFDHRRMEMLARWMIERSWMR